GYLTNGSDAGTVFIVDLNTYQITGEIPVGNGPEKMVYNDHYVFVVNSGGWGNDNTVSVINPNTDQVVDTIEVGDNPTDLVVDINNNIWVMCSGLIEYDDDWEIINETASKLVLINSNQLLTTGELQIGTIGDHVQEVEVSPSGGIIYVELNGVWDIPVSTGELSGEALIPTDLHTFNVDPSSGDIYGTTIPDFIGNDQVVVYNSSGVQEQTLDVGIAPNGVYFNN
ncbi:MAG: YncE family protein, partial [Flavobacteriales bacterium]